MEALAAIATVKAALAKRSASRMTNPRRFLWSDEHEVTLAGGVGKSFVANSVSTLGGSEGFEEDMRQMLLNEK